MNPLQAEYKKQINVDLQSLAGKSPWFLGDLHSQEVPGRISVERNVGNSEKREDCRSK